MTDVLGTSDTQRKLCLTEIILRTSKMQLFYVEQGILDMAIYAIRCHGTFGSIGDGDTGAIGTIIVNMPLADACDRTAETHPKSTNNRKNVITISSRRQPTSGQDIDAP